MSTTNTVQPNEWNLLPENHSSKSVKPNLADNHGMYSFLQLVTVFMGRWCWGVPAVVNLRLCTRRDMQARLSSLQLHSLTVHGHSHSFTVLRMKDGFWKDGVTWTPPLTLIRGKMLSTSFRCDQKLHFTHFPNNLNARA